MKPSRVVVVTGASAGAGRAIVRQFAQEGCSLGLIARGHDGLNAAKAEVEELGGKALVYAADVADADAIENAAAFFEEQLGPIDVWVNNAMVSVFSPIKEMTAAEFRRVTEVTYLGTVNGTLAALRRMLPRDHGVIIQVGSALAYRGIPLQAAYCASKHAIQGFMDSLRCELLHDRSRVRVSMVQMPAMNTPQFGWVKSRLAHKAQPVPPIFQPEIAARAVSFAARHPRREFWVGLPTIKAVFSNRVAPWFADWFLARNGVDSQQLDEREEPDRPNNLWQPLAGDHGAHGSFDSRAKSFSPGWVLSRNRPWLSALCAAAALGAITHLLRGKAARS
jgi:NAD(P)-dependent dehydrogenase (short-subunit alcohol dehydrogenase family)